MVAGVPAGRGGWRYNLVLSSTPTCPAESRTGVLRWSTFVETDGPWDMETNYQAIRDALKDLVDQGLDVGHRTVCIESVQLLTAAPVSTVEDDLMKAFDAGTRSVSELRSGLFGQQVEGESDLHAELHRLRGQNLGLRAENQKLGTRINDLRTAADAQIGILNTEVRQLRGLETDLLGQVDRYRAEATLLHTENVSLRRELVNLRQQVLDHGFEIDGDGRIEGDVPETLSPLILEQAAQIEQLRYERQLLGAARRVLDDVAESEGVGTGTARAAADMAQRIVDEIGHPITDEPALGPSLRLLRQATCDLVDVIDTDMLESLLCRGSLDPRHPTRLLVQRIRDLIGATPR